MSPRSVPCPTCQKAVEWSPDSPWRPFCSERCKLVDLGAWASEKHVIPGEEIPIVRDDGSDEAPRH